MCVVVDVWFSARDNPLTHLNPYSVLLGHKALPCVLALASLAALLPNMDPQVTSDMYVDVIVKVVTATGVVDLLKLLKWQGPVDDFADST